MDGNDIELFESSADGGECRIFHSIDNRKQWEMTSSLLHVRKKYWVVAEFLLTFL